MPQGAWKKKASAVQSKHKSIKKPTQQLRKGGKVIKPKKSKLIEVHNKQKTFTKALKERMEGELSAKATHVESKSFKVLQQPVKGKTDKPAT
ncbi:UPF0390 protein zgc136864-like [Watersipora subatra]|uniref:UPF0390 protein zgc136864-like n=1 Tax=Watersipora subatra TaxID=2589382 RepID=UPI00355BCD04